MSAVVSLYTFKKYSSYVPYIEMLFPYNLISQILPPDFSQQFQVLSAGFVSGINVLHYMDNISLILYGACIGAND